MTLRRAVWACRLLTIGFVGLFVCWPVARLAIEGMRTSAFVTTLRSARTWRVIWFTSWQASISTLTTAMIALPAAWLVGQYQFRGKHLMLSLWSAPFALPTIVVGAAFLDLLPASINRSAIAIISAHVFFNVGMVTRVVGAEWQRLDRRFQHVAATLGAPPMRQRLLAIQLLSPTVLSISGVVFSLCFTSFAIVRMLGGPRRNTIETEIWRNTTQALALDKAAVFALVQLVLVTTMLLVTTRRPTGTSAARPQLQPPPKAITGVIVCVLTAITVAPLLVLVDRALHWPRSDGLTFRAFTELRRHTQGSGLLNPAFASISQSIRSATMATALSLLVALCATTAGHKLRVLTSLPFAISSVTLGLGTLLAFARSPLAWRATWWMVPVVQAVVAFPFVVRVMRPAADAIDPRQRQVAATLGASPIRAWLRINAAQLRRPLLGAAGIAFAVALGEFGATTFLVRPRTETMPIAIGALASRPAPQLQAQASALAVILALLTMLCMTLSSFARQTP